MLAGEGRDLRQMRDAQNLLSARKGFQFLADGFSRAPPNADIDFIENKRTRSWIYFPRFRGAFFNCNFEGKHDARHLAAGGDLMKRLERFAGIGGDAVLDFVPSIGSPTRFLFER